MNITEQDLEEKYYKTIDGATRTPIFTYDEFDQETGTYKNLVIIKTADEAYQESLNPLSKPTEAEKQAELINNLILDNLNMQMQIDSLIETSLGGI